MPRILLWLFVINLGVALGAGLYEARINVPRWIAPASSSAADARRHWNAQAAQSDDTGRRFWVFVTTVPLTLLTLANLVAAWRAAGPVRGWWLASALTVVADRVITFAYFIPTMVRLTRAPDSPASVAAATQWAQLNHLRHALVLAALLTAMRAFALVYQRGG